MRKLVIAVLAAGLALIFGCSKARNDETIMTGIKAGLFSDTQTKSANIDVVVKNGTATLVGEVPDENTRYEAFKIAQETPGVVNVQDQMSLPQAPVSTASRTAADTAPAANKGGSGSKRARESLPVRPLASAANSNDSSAKSQDYSQQQSAQSQPAQAASEAPASAPAAAPESAAAPAAPAPPPVRQVSIPAGTPVHIQMIDSVDSATNHTGDLFHASLAFPIVVNGEAIVPTGADVYVKLTNSSSAGRMAGRSELTLQLARLDFQGKSYALASDDYQDVGKSRGKRTAETVGVGAAVGAVLGGIFGGGKGAAIGAGVGGGGGAAAEAATKGQQVHIAPETKLDFNLQQPVDITYSPGKNTSTR
ncbi:MAG: hypothetical protein DMG31_10980 [Acidobacteria bacterium]|nr:MAG: hypothetical protein DMG31_10980 [Acidobacteriota bacterium]